MKRWFLLVLLGLLTVSVVLADTETTTVTFVIPSSVDHSLTYGSSCSSTLFYYVETDTTKDGTLNMINASSDTSGASPCQTAGQGAFTVNNLGSASINVTMNFSSALPSGISVKSANASGGYEAQCTSTIAGLTACVNITNGAGARLIDNLEGQTGTVEIWTWVDMSNFNGGLATTGISREMNTTAVLS